MMVPWKVSRSTIAAQSRGSVKVLVQPEKLSLDAMATDAFSSRSVSTWNSNSAPPRDIVKTCGSVSFRRPPIRRFEVPPSILRG